MGPFKSYVLQAVKIRSADLDIKVIGPSHGPVLRSVTPRRP